MNIIRSGANQVSYLFNERLLPALSAQQQKLGIVTTVGLGALLFFVGCLACRSCWNSKKKVKPIIAEMTPGQKMEHINTLLRRGNEQYEKGELGNANIVFTEIVRLDPKNVEGLTMLGVVQRDQGEYEKSLEQIEKALKQNSKSPQALFQKGRTLQKLKKKGESQEAYGLAIIECKALRESGLADTSVLAILACSLFRMNRFDEAVEVYSTLIKIDKNVQWVQDYAECLEMLKRDGEAKEIYQQGLQAHPDNSDLLVSYARCLKRLGKRDEAIEQYEKLLQSSNLNQEERGIIKDELSRVLTAYATELKNAGNYEGAAALYDKCAECKKDIPAWKTRYEKMAEKLRAKSPRLQNQQSVNDQTTDEQCVEILNTLGTQLKRTDTEELNEALKTLQVGDIEEEKKIYATFSMRLKGNKQAEMKALLERLRNLDDAKVEV